MWMNLEEIMLSEVSQTVRHHRRVLSLTCGLSKKDTLNFFVEQILTHRLSKTCHFQRRQVAGVGGRAGGWKGK